MLRHSSARGLCRLLLTLFLVETTGCHSWRVTTMPPAVRQEGQRPDYYRVTLADSTRLEVAWIRSTSDTLYVSGREANVSDPTGELAIPRSQVLKVEERVYSTGKTVALITVLTGVLLYIMVAAMKAFEEDVLEPMICAPFGGCKPAPAF